MTQTRNVRFLNWCPRRSGLTGPDLGLQVLDNVIKTRWKVLPKEQRQGSLTTDLWLRLGNF